MENFKIQQKFSPSVIIWLSHTGYNKIHFRIHVDIKLYIGYVFLLPPLKIFHTVFNILYM